METKPNTNLFVNYLPPELGDQDLINLFSRFGQIESAKVLVDLVTCKSKCFGFVQFKSIDEASEAIRTMNGVKIGEKQLVVKYAHTSTSINTTNSDGTPSNNLYVKGLPLNINYEQLKALFSPFGNILETKILNDASTHLTRGMAFVRYSTTQEAENAIKNLNNTVIPGVTTPIVVRYADTEEERSNRRQRTIRKRQQQQRFTPYEQTPFSVQDPQLSGLLDAKRYTQTDMQGQTPFFGAHAASMPYPTIPVSQANDRMGLTNFYAMNGVQLPDPNLFVFNLPSNADDALLYRLFSPLGAIASVKVIKDPNTNECKGYGFVRMVNYFDAVEAVQAVNGTKIVDKILQVSFKRSENNNEMSEMK